MKQITRIRATPGKRIAGCLVALAMLAGMSMGCEKSGGAPDSPTTAPGAARPAPLPSKATNRSAGPKFRLECFDAYAGCPAVVGIPAISSDGKRVAVPDYGPDTGRDELILTMRIMAIATGKVVSETPLLTYRDYDRGRDPDTDQWTEKFRAELGDRVRAFEQVLVQGDYQPLLPLGTVHEDSPGEDVAGLRARFDGQQLVIEDTATSEPLWQRPVTPSTPFDRGDGEICGPFPVADVSVWVSRERGVAVARPTYIGSDLCPTEYPYLVWR
jgi:hypothetical protein